MSERILYLLIFIACVCVFVLVLNAIDKTLQKVIAGKLKSMPTTVRHAIGNCPNGFQRIPNVFELHGVKEDAFIKPGAVIVIDYLRPNERVGLFFPIEYKSESEFERDRR